MNVFPMFNSICLYLSEADTLLILTLFPNYFIYFVAFAVFSAVLKNSLIIHDENTKKNHKRVVSVYVIQIHVDLHKL
jgi:hypothetical protein